MREETRRAIANAVLPRSGEGHRALFSKTAGAWTNMTWSEDGFFDHASNAHVVRTDEGLYHHGLGAHIRLEVEGSQFRGYDHASDGRFNGTVQGTTAVIYDPGAGGHHLYRLQEVTTDAPPAI